MRQHVYDGVRRILRRIIRRRVDHRRMEFPISLQEAMLINVTVNVLMLPYALKKVMRR